MSENIKGLPKLPDSHYWELSYEGMFGMRLKIIKRVVKTHQRLREVHVKNPKYNGKWWSLKYKFHMTTEVYDVEYNDDTSVLESWVSAQDAGDGEVEFTEDDIRKEAFRMVKSLTVAEKNQLLSGNHGQGTVDVGL